MKKFEIVFDDQEVFFPGQTILGKLLCYTTESFDLKSIKIKLKGKGKVEWSEDGTETYNEDSETKTRTVTEYYRNKEEYFETKMHLFGTGERCELSAGEYSFEFSFILPKCLPSSFTHEYGQIKYKAKATIDLPWATDIECKKEFTVHNHVSLNDLPQGNEPIQMEDSKHVGCCCCKTGPITCRCWLPKRGYLPGETLSFSAEIENLSNRNMRGSELKLVQKITYHAQSKTRTEHNIVWKDARPGFEREDYWSDCRILLSSMYPSPFRGTSLIDIDYELQFEVDPGSLSTNLVLALPILIGTEQVVPNPFSNAIPLAPPIGFSVPPDTAHALPQPPYGYNSYNPVPSSEQPINACAVQPPQTGYPTSPAFNPAFTQPPYANDS